MNWVQPQNDMIHNNAALVASLMTDIILSYLCMQLPWLLPFLQSIFWLGLFLVMSPLFSVDRFAGGREGGCGGRGGVCSMWDGNCMLNICKYIRIYVYICMLSLYLCCISVHTERIQQRKHVNVCIVFSCPVAILSHVTAIVHSQRVYLGTLIQ